MLRRLAAEFDAVNLQFRALLNDLHRRFKTVLDHVADADDFETQHQLAPVATCPQSRRKHARRLALEHGHLDKVILAQMLCCVRLVGFLERQANVAVTALNVFLLDCGRVPTVASWFCVWRSSDFET